MQLLVVITSYPGSCEVRLLQLIGSLHLGSMYEVSCEVSCDIMPLYFQHVMLAQLRGLSGITSEID